MSRSATVSTSKNPSQRPSKSAWARGPPQNSATTSSHSQSLAPPTPASVTNPASFHAPHPRSSSALGQGVSIKDGINVPRSTVKQGSAVTFGSIGDASAPISSSQASAPTVKPAEGVKPFDLVVQNGASDATKPAVTNRPLPLPSTSTSHLAPPASTPPVPKPGMFTKLFSYPSTQSVPTPPHEAASPASRSASIPSQPSRGQPSPPTLSSGALSRGQNGNPSAPPPSPVYPRPIANGQNGVVGTSGGRPEAGSSPPNAGPAPPAMPSPRLIPDAPPGPSNGLPPPPTMWSGYYYHPQFLPGVPQPAVPIVPAVPPFPAPVQKDIKRPIRIESQEQRENRLVEEKARENESEEKNKTSETFDKASEDTARREIEERELHKVVERKLKEEVERAEKEWKEAEERAARGERERKEADERAAREEEERKQAEERAAREARKAEEREKGRLRLEEVRARREAEEKVQRERAEQERLRKLKEEEEAKEAAEQRRRAEEEALRADSLPEEGETEDKVPRHTTAEQTPSSKTASVPPPTPIPADLSAKSSEKEPIRTDTSLRSPEYQRKRPGLRNSHTTITSNSAPAFPSALPTGQHTEDINRISYPEGIEIPKVELNVNAQEGKFHAGTASVVPIESLLSGPYMKSPFSLKASRARLTGPGARPVSSLGMGSGESKTLDVSRQQSDDSFLRHGKYFFNDGNVTFLVDGFLFCVHRYLFSHDSLYFSNRFTQLGVRDHEALSTIVSLGDVECEDFEAFLSVLYPHFEEQDLSYEQWRSVLHLSTRWGFASRRRLALESIKPPTSYDRLLLARKYAVDHWVIPALTALCERTAPLSLDEARRMNIEDVVLVATVREDIFRSGGNATEIPRRVEAMQAEVLVRFADDDESLASSTSGATEQGPGSTVNATISSDSEARSRNGTTTAVIEPVKGKTPMSGWNLAGATTKSQRENNEQSDGTSNDEWDTLPFEGEKVNMQADEEQHYQTTKVASNDERDMLPSKRKRVRSKRMNVQHWQNASTKRRVGPFKGTKEKK